VYDQVFYLTFMATCLLGTSTVSRLASARTARLVPRCALLFQLYAQMKTKACVEAFVTIEF